MHDFLEGTLVYNLKIMMRYLEKEKILTIIQLNNSIKAFKYGRINRKNEIPYDLFKREALKNKKGLKLSATHMWTLIRVFPILFDQRLNDNIYYLHF
jgi:hypothetical protein